MEPTARNRRTRQGPPCCYSCGQPGHFSRECPQRSRGAPPPSRTPTTTSEGFFDAHCHVDSLLQRARCPTWGQFLVRSPPSPGFLGCITSFSDPSALSPSLGSVDEVLAEVPGAPRVWCSFGMHPHHARYYDQKMEDRVLQMITRHRAAAGTSGRCVAWGECGLDFERSQSSREEQVSAFSRQLVRAVELGLPVVVHSRAAWNETVQTLKALVPRDHGLHIHCHADGPDAAAALMAEFPRAYFGLTGATVSHTNGQMAATAGSPLVPLSRILLETDSPYMPATRGGHSHPGVTPVQVAEAVASLRGNGLTASDVLRATCANTRDLYGLP